MAVGRVGKVVCAQIAQEQGDGLFVDEHGAEDGELGVCQPLVELHGLLSVLYHWAPTSPVMAGSVREISTALASSSQRRLDRQRHA